MPRGVPNDAAYAGTTGRDTAPAAAVALPCRRVAVVAGVVLTVRGLSPATREMGITAKGVDYDAFPIDAHAGLDPDKRYRW